MDGSAIEGLIEGTRENLAIQGAWATTTMLVIFHDLVEWVDLGPSIIEKCESQKSRNSRYLRWHATW